MRSRRLVDDGTDSAIRLDSNNLMQAWDAGLGLEQAAYGGDFRLDHLKIFPVLKLTFVSADEDFFLAVVAAER